ncbi:hypothetical protein [Pseudomonas shahriarae]|uniref:hypothetical protein n=1 Tax=Pseudomonas shahriarae TaxID=2745512 RepID=UPI0023623CCE|nr:hypothetical protein [Pseudomonas shahriarae]MDD0982049.1 hypothetical protein [Pseudomonas shahriarae]
MSKHLDVVKKYFKYCVDGKDVERVAEFFADDVVVVALMHHAKGSNIWHGFDVSGKDLSWSALTYFRFNAEGKVVEEIVERNELFMAKQLGIVEYD